MAYKYRIYPICIVLALTALFLAGGCGGPLFQEDLKSAKYRDPALSADERVADLLPRMTLNEKIGQMVIPDRGALKEDNDIAVFLVGALLSGGGSSPLKNTPEEWALMYDRFQSFALKTRLAIPLMYGIDAVHGNNNVYGSVIFPHNIGLGATGDEALVRKIGSVTSSEVAGTGIDWNFAPCVAIPLNERWGRTYEGFSEYAPLVGKLGAAYILGFQDSGLPAGNNMTIATAKHYLGDGGTRDGVDRGFTVAHGDELNKVYLVPYVEAVKAGVKTVMVSFSSFNGVKMHANGKMVTSVLKNELGFKGFVVSDWNGIEEIDARYPDCVKKSVNAGVDMFMEPYKYQSFLLTLKSLVMSKDVSEERINDAVARILKVKFEMGLFEHPFTDKALTALIGSQAHRAVAREAVRKSLVLLKNNGRLLPLSRKIKSVFVAGKSADDIGNQCGGWTMSWQGTSGRITEGTTILEAVKKAVSPQTKVTYEEFGRGARGSDVAVVVIGELPYAEMKGDKQDLSVSQSDVDTVDNCLASGVPVVVILVSGRPMILTEPMKRWNALIAAWLPGTEGDGVADVLFGDYAPTGKLAYTWPRDMAQIPINTGDKEYKPLFPFGYGLTY